MTKHEHRGPAWSAHSKARVIPMAEERLDSRDLFTDSRVITIAHGAQTYQLRLTAQDKLILTK
ncbi:hemin uptake protein hemP [Aquabacter spiritensis]|uniref:Hemin uptake protein hemP n=1 Tax=Aquabacter spiritensis TaxID=933073 RepID=A0A4R3LVF9_9HYPH|nr:hemin uptake protein hemP [Aquabacter spiritensis]